MATPGSKWKFFRLPVPAAVICLPSAAAASAASSQIAKDFIAVAAPEMQNPARLRPARAFLRTRQHTARKIRLLFSLRSAILSLEVAGIVHW